MEESLLLPSWIESTPESKSLTQSERLLQLSDMLSSNRKMFENCLPTQNCEKLAAISDMLRLASNSPMDVDVDKILSKVNSLINPPEDGNKTEPGVVESDLQVDTYAGLNLGCPGTGNMDVAGGYGSSRVTATSGIFGDEGQAHLQKSVVDRVQGDKGSVFGTVSDADVTVDYIPTSSLPRDSSCASQRVDCPFELNAAPILIRSHHLKPNPNPRLPSVPFQTRCNYDTATRDRFTGVPLHGMIINNIATEVSSPCLPVQGDSGCNDNYILDIPSVPRPVTSNYNFATPDFIPNVPMHGLENQPITTADLNAIQHPSVERMDRAGLGDQSNHATYYYGAVQDLLRTNDDPEIDEILSNIKSSDLCPTSSAATNRLQKAMDSISLIQKRKSKEQNESLKCNEIAAEIHKGNTENESPKKGQIGGAQDLRENEKKDGNKSDFQLLGDLKKHLSKGATSTNILLQKFHSCVSTGATAVDETDHENEENSFKAEEANAVKKNYAQALNGDGSAKVRVVPTPAKPIEIPFYPENLNKKEVRIKDETLKKGAIQWKNCVVGKFIARRPPGNLIRSRVMALWQKKGLISIMEQDDDFIFKFETEDQRNHILETRVWMIAGQQMIISGWLEENAHFYSHFTKFPIWVKLLKVPPVCWTAEGIGQIASTIGKPLGIDEITATRQYMNYARVKIEVEAGVKKPRAIKVDLGENVNSEVLVHYTGCPPSCMECKVFGHFTSKCPKKRGDDKGKHLIEEKILEDKNVEGKEELEGSSNLKKDDAILEDTAMELRAKEDEAQAKATIGRQQEMEHSGDSSRFDAAESSQDCPEKKNPNPNNQVEPKNKGLSKSQKKKLKKATHGKGGGVNGRTPNHEDNRDYYIP